MFFAKQGQLSLFLIDLAPLMVLLRMVTGMIGPFQVTTLFGAYHPMLISSGISQAFLAADLDLRFAIPIKAVRRCGLTRVWLTAERG